MKPSLLRKKTCEFALQTAATQNLLKDQKDYGMTGQASLAGHVSGHAKPAKLIQNSELRTQN